MGVRSYHCGILDFRGGLDGETSPGFTMTDLDTNLSLVVHVGNPNPSLVVMHVSPPFKDSDFPPLSRSLRIPFDILISSSPISNPSLIIE